MVSAGIKGGYLVNPMLAEVHWQAGMPTGTPTGRVASRGPTKPLAAGIWPDGGLLRPSHPAPLSTAGAYQVIFLLDLLESGWCGAMAS
jgi:hypothetical protein